MDYISTALVGNPYIDSVIIAPSLHSYPNHDPLITPLTINWQKERCSQLKISFIEPIKQPTNFTGSKLKDYLPWQFEDIGKDGNCLFRCLSKIISGSQEYYPKMRGEICRFIAKDGKDKLQWYLNTRKETPLDYLLRTMMDEDRTWGTEVEILAASGILEAGIYVATESKIVDDSSLFPFSERVIHWNRYSTAPNSIGKLSIYIANFENHFEPVVNFINSIYPTYAKKNADVICLD